MEKSILTKSYKLQMISATYTAVLPVGAKARHLNWNIVFPRFHAIAIAMSRGAAKVQFQYHLPAFEASQSLCVALPFPAS